MPISERFSILKKQSVFSFCLCHHFRSAVRNARLSLKKMQHVKDIQKQQRFNEYINSVHIIIQRHSVAFNRIFQKEIIRVIWF